MYNSTKKCTDDTDKKAVAEEKKNNSKEKSSLIDSINIFLCRNKDIVIALSALGSFIATTVLVIITAISLNTVKDQQKLSIKQFVLANEPSLRVYPRKNNPAEFTDENVIFHWVIANQGGPVHNLKFITFLASFSKKGTFRNLELTLIKDKMLKRRYSKNRLNRMEISNYFMSTGPDFGSEWVKEALMNDDILVLISFKVGYEIPPELTLDGKKKKDSIIVAYKWMPHLKKLTHVYGVEFDAAYNALIESKIIRKEEVESNVEETTVNVK